MRPIYWLSLFAACGLAACAAHPPAAPGLEARVGPAPPPPSQSAAPPDHLPPDGFEKLPGWAEENHVEALTAFIATCDAARAPTAREVCRRARSMAAFDEGAARQFLETHFRPEAASDPGLLTAYFTPIYEARDHPDDVFSAPVRPYSHGPGLMLSGPDQHVPDRAAIDSWPTDDALAWMRPEELFFLQIQGSGVLVFPDGQRLRTVFDGTNGAPFIGIAAPMRRQGLLADNATSGDAIRRWLAAHRGPQAQAVMSLNPRYVFFRLTPDDGADPAGAAGVPLIAGRAVAADPSLHAMGDLVWIDASAPTLSGAFPTYRRLAVVLDVGGAIKGDARADLYLGRGEAAGLEAGRVRHVLRIYRLTPVDRPGV